MSRRAAAIREKLLELQGPLEEAEREAPEEPSQGPGRPRPSGPLERCVVSSDKGEIVVTIGTSADAVKDPSLVARICAIVDTAYSSVGKHKYMDQEDALDRLEMGDDGIRANRVLHLAYREGILVGCASSTFSPGWTPPNCGHWGLLAVDPESQGQGVASALVLAAERRLATVSEAIQIEFQHTEGEKFSHRLLDWYEKMGFRGGPRSSRPGTTSFRRCFKEISEDYQAWGRKQRLVAIRDFLNQQLMEEEAHIAAAGAETAEARSRSR